MTLVNQRGSHPQMRLLFVILRLRSGRGGSQNVLTLSEKDRGTILSTAVGIPLECVTHTRSLGDLGRQRRRNGMEMVFG